MKRMSLLTFLIVGAFFIAACGAPAAPAPAAEATEAPMEEAAAEEAEATEEPAEEAEATEAPAEEEAMAEVSDIVDTAVAAGSFTTLAAALDAAGLVETLKGEGPFTVFAPTDDAFAALPEGTVEGLLEDPQGALTDILLYHVVPGAVAAADVVGLDGETVETVGGAPLAISIGDDGSVMINDSMVVTPDVMASNGIIHVIDAVLLPPAGEEAEATEEASEEAEATEEASEEAMGDMSDIVDTAVAAGSFTTLAAALDAAGLVETLKGEGPFTVFAPSDDAFAALPEGTVESLLEDPQGALTDILLYHVVPGKVMAADVVALDGQEVETAGGSMLTVTIGDDGSVMINDATVAAPDVEASNGVIHVIDSVLIPASE
jgi:transforming growth factor-beta-induced protein